MSTRAGFTLIEVIVALTVGSLALLAGMAVLGFVSDRSIHSDDAVVGAIGGATQRATLVEWLSGARYRAVTGEEFVGMQQDEGGEIVDLLLFPTTSRTPLDGSSTVVGLYVDHDPETPERGLVAEMTGMTFGGEPRRMELVPEVGRMLIRYLPVEQNAPWDVTWQSRNSLPRAVEITLFPVAGDSLPLLLRYPIRVALGAVR